MKQPTHPKFFHAPDWPENHAGVGYIGSSARDDRAVHFLSDDQDDDGLDEGRTPWQILVVDDDPFVHEVTVLALGNEKVHGREMTLSHAYSAAEARERIAASDAIDLVLLDIVMETHDAGLQLAKAIRYELGRVDLKIIVRTGQPGLERDEVVRMAPEIDGYVNKAALSLAALREAIATLLPRD